MALPPMKPFAIPAIHAVPVFTSELTGSRCREVSTAQTGLNHERQLRCSPMRWWPGHADGIALSVELTAPGPCRHPPAPRTTTTNDPTTTHAGLAEALEDHNCGRHPGAIDGSFASH
jgi:hypothetical protein